MWKQSAVLFSLCAAATTTAGFGVASGHASATPAHQHRSHPRPNVVVIVADDLGYGDTSLYNGSIDTPNIAGIASSGTTFTSGHVASPVCAPSRYGLLTGHDPSRYDANSEFTTHQIQPKTFTGETEPGPGIAKLLKRQGYDTAAIGKWDVSGVGTSNSPAGIAGHPNLPDAEGFDQYYGILGGIANSYCPQDAESNDVFSYDRSTSSYVHELPTKYLTDEFTDRAADYVRGHASGKKPFFLYLTPNAPHVVIDRSFGPKGTAYQPPQSCPERVNSTSRTAYEQTVENLDGGIGHVLTALRQSKAAKNTIVVFLSDNGPVHAGTAGPLRGSKFTDFEGGLRVPFAVSWPGHIRPDTTYTRPVSSLDLLPTLADAAGASSAVRHGHYPGVALTSILDRRRSNPPALRWRYYNDDAESGNAPVGTARLALLDHNLKYIRDVMPDGTSSQYLFDFSHPGGLSEDANEFGNPRYRTAVRRLTAQYAQWDQRSPVDETFTTPRPETQLPDGWARSGTGCAVSSGMLQCQAGDEDSSAVDVGSDFTAPEAAADVRFDSTGRAGLLLASARAQNVYPLDGYEVSLDNGANLVQVSHVRDNRSATLAERTFPVSSDTTYRLGAELRGGRLRVSVNGRVVLTTRARALTPGTSVGLQSSDVAVGFDNITAQQS